MQIIKVHKNQLHPLNSGYDLRELSPQAFTIIIHSTNGRKGSSFTAELNYLLNSGEVSAHYLIGKTGQIVQFFDDIPRIRAWHVGTVSSPRFDNNYTIGIETHFSPGEENTPGMEEALTWLVRELHAQYKIIGVEAHRDVAVYASGPRKGQLGRKVDPSQYTKDEFEQWKERIVMQSTRIIGHSSIDIDILRAKLANRGVWVYELNPLVCAYTSFGELTRMGNVYPLAQWAHETGWGKSPRWVEARNPAGLGATNDGAWGATFNSIAEGVLAQYAHLLCYATKPEENSFIIERIAQLSPRKDAMVAKFGRGSAPTWELLNGKWAFPGTTYAQKIFDIAKYLST